jgi:hypothetical protein
VAEQAQPGDGIIFLSRYGRPVFEYYLDRSPAQPALVPLYPRAPWRTYMPILDERDTGTPADGAQALASMSRVWVVLLWGGFESRAEDAAPIRAALDDFTAVESRPFGPSLEARLYVRRRR